VAPRQFLGEPSPLEHVFKLGSELPAFRQSFDTVLSFTYIAYSTGLPDLLLHTEDSSCSDPRDRIFALLSLANQSTRNCTVPNYKKSPADLYREVTQYLIVGSTLRR
jgi:hypothetical protein